MAEVEPRFEEAGKEGVELGRVEKSFGVPNSRRFVATEEPEEEAEYVGKLKAKGYSAKDAAAAWKEKLVTCEVADYKGLKGSVRLWIEQKPKRTREKELFGETSATQGSDRMKDPKDEVIDAMRSFCNAGQVPCFYLFLNLLLFQMVQLMVFKIDPRPGFLFRKCRPRSHQLQ